MFDRVWRRVVIGRYRFAPATLAGYRRFRVRGETYPAIVASAKIGGAVIAEARGAVGIGEETVTGVLYFDVAPADLARLDRFEGEDYQRIPVEVTVGPSSDRLTAQAYLYRMRDRIEPEPWDPVWFEREGIESFLRDYPPAAVGGGVAPD